MKKTNQKYKSQKQRLNSILLALIWGATIITGCKPATPDILDTNKYNKDVINSINNFYLGDENDENYASRFLEVPTKESYEEGLSESDYTEDSWESFSNALAKYATEYELLKEIKEIFDGIDKTNLKIEIDKYFQYVAEKKVLYKNQFNTIIDAKTEQDENENSFNNSIDKITGSLKDDLNTAKKDLNKNQSGGESGVKDPKPYADLSFEYGNDNIGEFVSKINEDTKTITFNVPATEIAVIDFYNNYIELKTKVEALENKPTLNVNFKNLGNTKFTTNEDKFFDLGSLKSLETLIFGENNFNYKDKPYEITDLPYFEVDISDDNMTTNLELYNTGIDTIIKKYYDVGNVGNKLNVDKLMGFKAGHHFDATPFLNGGQMYDENEYNTNSAYKLDINAALLMGASLKNVEIIGTNKTSKNTIDEVTNVRVSSDVSDITFGAGSGVIDFEIAPVDIPFNSVLSSTQAKVIIRNIKEGSRVYIGSNHTIDLSNLPVSSFQNIDNLDRASFVEVYFAQGQENKGFGVSAGPSFNKAIYVDGALTSVKDGYTPLKATNADWERAGNADGGIPTIPQNTANVSQANVKSVKSLVMKRLLDDNQRVYG